jgi:predicted RND superfamily exporter protein
MNKLSTILVKQRKVFFTISIVFAILFAFCISSVNLNKDDTKYLAQDSNMSQGLKIIEEEFPPIELRDGFQIMFEGLTASTKLEIYKELKDFPGVENVTYDPESSEYNSKTFTMYVVETKYGELPATYFLQS